MVAIHAELLTNARNRPYLRDAAQFALRQLKGVIVHLSTQSSSAPVRRLQYNDSADEHAVHYLVDDRTVIQCIPDNEVAFHNHDRLPAMPSGNQSLPADYFFIGMELCAPAGADWSKMLRLAADAAGFLLRKHRLELRHLQYDGAPGQLNTSDNWKQFLALVDEAIADIPEGLAERARVSAGQSPVFRGPGHDFPVAERLPEGALVAVFEHQGDWRRIGRHLWMAAEHLRREKPELLHFVREAVGANVRSGPGMQFPVVDALPCRSIVDALRNENQWVAIGEQRWVHGSALSPVRLSHGEVFGTTSLYVRSGPDTTYHIVRQLPAGAPVEIWEEHGAWFRIGDDEWVYGSFIDRS
ncbi:MAG: SH3 domain-containing protein [Saprospiraceae bacterium]|nr:SH3 domain-containing protein [Saprospiraceae bacterium]